MFDQIEIQLHLLHIQSVTVKFWKWEIIWKCEIKLKSSMVVLRIEKLKSKWWNSSFAVLVSPLTSNADCEANRKGVYGTRIQKGFEQGGPGGPAPILNFQNKGNKWFFYRRKIKDWMIGSWCVLSPGPSRQIKIFFYLYAPFIFLYFRSPWLQRRRTPCMNSANTKRGFRKVAFPFIVETLVENGFVICLPF